MRVAGRGLDREGQADLLPPGWAGSRARMPPPARRVSHTHWPSGRGQRLGGAQETGLRDRAELLLENPSRVCGRKSGANRAQTGGTFLRTWKAHQPDDVRPRFSTRPHKSAQGAASGATGDSPRTGGSSLWVSVSPSVRRGGNVPTLRWLRLHPSAVSGAAGEEPGVRTPRTRGRTGD